MKSKILLILVLFLFTSCGLKEKRAFIDIGERIELEILKKKIKNENERSKKINSKHLVANKEDTYEKERSEGTE